MNAAPHLSNLREDAVSIWNAGVDGVRPEPLIQRVVHVEGKSLFIDDHSWHGDDFDRILIVGAGKATAGMATGLVAAIGSWRPITGWINVPEGTERELDRIHVHVGRPAGVNEPRPEGVEGTNQILALVNQAGPRDLCIALFSGGGSALLPAPIDGITLDDKLTVTRLLSDRGANITELNTVRKHLSRVKGGGLLRACRAGALVTLILSDVLGDPLDLIASGPTVADPSSPQNALDVLAKFDPHRQLPATVYEALLRRRDPERPNQSMEVEHVVIGNNALAVDAAGIRAEQLGYNHAMQSSRSAEGSAEAVGHHLADMVVRMLRDQTTHPTDCLITGGEPTVSLVPREVRGQGGRNQQLVLAAYQRLLAHQISDDEWQRIAILSGGTDGEDGPTDAAGALLDVDVHRMTQQRSIDVNHYLMRNDAYGFFRQTGGLLLVGPTGTNVCDVRVAIARTPRRTLPSS